MIMRRETESVWVGTAGGSSADKLGASGKERGRVALFRVWQDWADQERAWSACGAES
jgi:hypothetical protein